VRDRSYGEELPEMLLSHLGAKINGLASQWDEVRGRIRTAQDVERRNQFVREKFREMIHGFPQKTPLDPVVVKTNERDVPEPTELLGDRQPLHSGYRKRAVSGHPLSMWALGAGAAAAELSVRLHRPG
jgi:hypothetical protein